LILTTMIPRLSMSFGSRALHPCQSGFATLRPSLCRAAYFDAASCTCCKCLARRQVVAIYSLSCSLDPLAVSVSVAASQLLCAVCQ
jgi:hypothetical protein